MAQCYRQAVILKLNVEIFANGYYTIGHTGNTSHLRRRKGRPLVSYLSVPINVKEIRNDNPITLVICMTTVPIKLPMRAKKRSGIRDSIFCFLELRWCF